MIQKVGTEYTEQVHHSLVHLVGGDKVSIQIVGTEYTEQVHHSMVHLVGDIR